MSHTMLETKHNGHTHGEGKPQLLPSCGNLHNSFQNEVLSLLGRNLFQLNKIWFCIFKIVLKILIGVTYK